MIFKSLNGVVAAVVMRDGVSDAQALSERRNAIDVNLIIGCNFMFIPSSMTELVAKANRGGDHFALPVQTDAGGLAMYSARSDDAWAASSSDSGWYKRPNDQPYPQR
jgi:hypothetical protein